MFWAEPSNLEGWLVKIKKNKSSTTLYGVVIRDINNLIWGRWNYSRQGALNVFNHSKWETLSLRSFNMINKEDANIQLLEFIEYPSAARFSSPESYTDKSDIDSEFRNLNEWHWEDKNLPFMKDEFIGEETHQWKKDPRVFQELDEEQGYAYNGVQSSKKLGWRFVVNEDERDKVHYFLLSIKDQSKLNALLLFFDLVTEEKKLEGYLHDAVIIQAYWNSILFEIIKREGADIYTADRDFYNKFKEKLREKRGKLNTLVEMLIEGKNSTKLSWKNVKNIVFKDALNLVANGVRDSGGNFKDAWKLVDNFPQEVSSKDFEDVHDNLLVPLSNKDKIKKRVNISQYIWMMLHLYSELKITDSFTDWLERGSVEVYRGSKNLPPLEIPSNQFFSFTLSESYALNFVQSGWNRGEFKDFDRVHEGYLIKTNIPIKNIHIYNDAMGEKEIVIKGPLKFDSVEKVKIKGRERLSWKEYEIEPDSIWKNIDENKLYYVYEIGSSHATVFEINEDTTLKEIDLLRYEPFKHLRKPFSVFNHYLPVGKVDNFIKEGNNSTKLSWKEDPVRRMLVSKHGDIWKLEDLTNEKVYFFILCTGLRETFFTEYPYEGKHGITFKGWCGYTLQGVLYDYERYKSTEYNLPYNEGGVVTLIGNIKEEKFSSQVSNSFPKLNILDNVDIFKSSSLLPKGEEIIDYDINPLTEMNLFPSKRKDNYDYKKRNTKGDEEMIFEKGTHQDINRPETSRPLTPYGNKLSWKESIVDENPVVCEIKNVIYVLDSRYYSNQYTWYAVPLSLSDYERLGEVECLVGRNVKKLLDQYHTVIKKFKENDPSYINITNVETLPKECLINPQIMPIQIISSLQNSLFIYIKPDEKIPLNINEAHTTLIYLKDEIEGKDRQRVIEDISNLLKNYDSSLCKWTGVATFDNEDKSRVILVNFENGAKLYSEVLDILSNYIDIDREFDFIPHMTIEKSVDIKELPEYEWKTNSLFIEFEKTVPAIEIEFKTGKIKESQTLSNSVDENLVKLTFINKEEVV